MIELYVLSVLVGLFMVWFGIAFGNLVVFTLGMAHIFAPITAMIIVYRERKRSDPNQGVKQ